MTTTDLEIEPRLPRPRIRTGAIVWGLIVTAVGVGALVLLINPWLREALLDSLLALTPLGLGLALLAALGLLILVIALVVLIRRAQQRSELRHVEALAGERE
jgi:hypothetical protein